MFSVPSLSHIELECSYWIFCFCLESLLQAHYKCFVCFYFLSTLSTPISSLVGRQQTIESQQEERFFFSANVQPNWNRSSCCFMALRVHCAIFCWYCCSCCSCYSACLPLLLLLLFLFSFHLNQVTWCWHFDWLFFIYICERVSEWVCAVCNSFSPVQMVLVL